MENRKETATVTGPRALAHWRLIEGDSMLQNLSIMGKPGKPSSRKNTAEQIPDPNHPQVRPGGGKVKEHHPEEYDRRENSLCFSLPLPPTFLNILVKISWNQVQIDLKYNLKRKRNPHIMGECYVEVKGVWWASLPLGYHGNNNNWRTCESMTNLWLWSVFCPSWQPIHFSPASSVLSHFLVLTYGPQQGKIARSGSL